MEVVFSKKPFEDYEKLKQYPALVEKVKALVELLKINPFQTPPKYEKLQGQPNMYSRRINVQHRLVYEVRKDENVVVIARMWTHYQ